MIAAGTLRHQIEIQRYTETQNDFGEVIEEWNTLHTVRASIAPLSGKEYFASKQVNAETTHQVYIRYISGLKPADRILFNGRIFNILNILNYKEKNVSLELLCTEQI